MEDNRFFLPKTEPWGHPRGSINLNPESWEANKQSHCFDKYIEWEWSRWVFNYTALFSSPSHPSTETGSVLLIRLDAVKWEGASNHNCRGPGWQKCQLYRCRAVEEGDGTFWADFCKHIQYILQRNYYHVAWNHMFASILLLINYYHRKTNLFCLSAFRIPLCSFLSSCLCSLSPSIHCTVPSSPALLALYLSLLPKCIQNVIRHFIVVSELRHFRFEMCLKQHTDMSKMCAV